MSVIVVLRVPGDPAAFESYAKAHADQMTRIAGEGKSAGAKHHLFAVGDGEIVIVDEWESAEQFQAFFGGQPEIPGIMQAAGATGEPQMSFYRKLDTADEF